MSTMMKNECRRAGATATEPGFDMTTRPSPTNQRVLALIDAIAIP
jgi:hypothetical protein